MTTMPDGVSPADADVSELIERVRAGMPRLRQDLERLVRIPSVSAAADQAPVRASAQAVAELLREAGLDDVEILSSIDPATGQPGAPAVLGHRPAPPGAPTVLLYAHHDVQPPGRSETWQSDPFEPSERGGRLYGRGAADDKAGVCAHLAAVRSLNADAGIGVTVFVEGEEEIGSPSFEAFLREHHDRLVADVVVVADSGNWRIGAPALTTSLRGNAIITVSVSTLDHAVHSGMYGGAVPDAALALIRTLNALWDANGDLAVPGLTKGSASLDYPEADFRADSGILDGVELIGGGTISDRLWNRPALTVVATDLPTLANASNTLQPKASARLSMRIAPDQDGDAAVAALSAHLRASAPWGAKVEIEVHDVGLGWTGDVGGDVYDAARWALRQAWGGAEPVHMGVGGSIPFIASLAEILPEAVVLLTGVEDPDTRAHGENESLHLAEFERACIAHALLLHRLARPIG